MEQKKPVYRVKNSMGQMGTRTHYIVNVTQRDINNAVPMDSRHCAIREAIRSSIPDASTIMVDTQTIRFTVITNKKRYVYLTPGLVQEFIVRFDELKHVAPFSFSLGHPIWIGELEEVNGEPRVTEANHIVRVSEGTAENSATKDVVVKDTNRRPPIKRFKSIPEFEQVKRTNRSKRVRGIAGLREEAIQ